MLVISERINGLFKSVGKAIDARDANFIQNLALDQVKVGANILDINTGPGVENAPEVMKWLVETVQQVVKVPLSIDTPDIKTMEMGIKTSKNKVMINSTTADAYKMNALFPLAKEYSTDIICLTLNEKGIPNDAISRCELAMLMVTTAMEHGLSPDNLFLDPLILPVGAAQDQGAKVFEAIQMFKTICEPKPKTVVGLSNVSNGTKNRPLINRTYLIMLMSHGLDSAIMNPSDKDLMDAVKTSEVLLNQKLYCDDYLRA
jgi:5-methyltetrahydrofolate corrinoid/iron sulfur protein methyltransferase